MPSTLSIHSIGIPSIPNLAPKQAPITVALEQQSPPHKMFCLMADAYVLHQLLKPLKTKKLPGR